MRPLESSHGTYKCTYDRTNQFILQYSFICHVASYKLTPGFLSLLCQEYDLSIGIRSRPFESLLGAFQHWIGRTVLLQLGMAAQDIRLGLGSKWQA